MRKLILPVVGILGCMFVTAMVVSRLAAPPAPTSTAAVNTTSSPPQIQPPSEGVLVDLRPNANAFESRRSFPRPLPTPPLPPAQAPGDWNHPAADQVHQVHQVHQVRLGPETNQMVSGNYPNTGQPRLAPSPAPQAQPQAPAPATTDTVFYQQPMQLGDIHQIPQAQFSQNQAQGHEPVQLQRLANTAESNSRPQFAQGYEQSQGAYPGQIQLTSSLQLAANYDNTIAPEEDLLQGANIPGANAAPPTSVAPPTSAAPSTPSTPATPVDDTFKRLPDVIQPTNPPATNPPAPNPVAGTPVERLPSPTQSTPTQPTPTQPTAPSNGGWNKNTPPADDEDLLQGGDIDELPVPNNNQQTPTGPTTPNNAGDTNQQGATDTPNKPADTPRKAPATDLTNQRTSPFTKTAPHTSSGATPPSEPGVDPHLEIYAENCFPSAKKCKGCHEKIYEEWAGSSHAYASISPMFQKFEQTIHGLAMGTISHFCMRCHAPVATALSHPREASIWESVPSAREGVTCIACHRVAEEYGKVNGERRIEMGDIHQPVYGAGYGQKLAEVIKNKSKYKVKTSPGEKGPGQAIHTKVIHFEQIKDSSFCVSCHQVAVAPGIALEVVWAQYRASPACKEGITCQECHMGREPGVAAGYDTAPVAIVNGKEITPERKHSNHMFYGPGYSIAHPGLFPHNEKSEEWSMNEWLQFDYRSGWGTEKFEELVDDGKLKPVFPEAWSNADDRADAREVVDKNLEKLEEKRHMRHRLMENGSHLEGPIFKREPRAGQRLQFRYDVTNTNPGHNMPSGSLGAQPQVWLNVVLTGPNGQWLWESGYVDRNGDIADVHSLEVAAGRIKRDVQLFNLQTKFLITGAKGTDREMYLPVNTDFDQLPFIRASGFPVTVMNHPPFIRMEGHSVPPLATMQAKYHVPAKLMRQPGVYRLSVRMRSRAEPIYFMRFCKATPEMERGMNHWMLDYHEESFRFMVQ